MCGTGDGHASRHAGMGRMQVSSDGPVAGRRHRQFKLAMKGVQAESESGGRGEVKE